MDTLQSSCPRTLFLHPRVPSPWNTSACLGLQVWQRDATPVRHPCQVRDTSATFRMLLCGAYLPSLLPHQACRAWCWLSLAAGILAMPVPLDKTSSRQEGRPLGRASV